MNKKLKHSVFWYEQKKEASGVARSVTAPLAADRSCDVIIVGGGMAGLTAAERFSREGKSVVLLECDFCGAGASGKTSGFITPDSEIELSTLVENRGPAVAKTLWEFVSGGVEQIRTNIHTHALDCDYNVQNSLFIATTEKGMEHTAGEHAARKQLGYASTLHDRTQVQSVIGSKKYFGGVEYSDTFGMNSYLFCQGMKAVLQQKGVHIFEHTRVDRIHAGGVNANGCAVHATHVVVCADRFTPQLGALKKDIYHVQTFLMVSNPLPEAVIARIFPQGKKMVWDTDLIYQYYRVTGDNRMLIGVGDFLWTYRRKENVSPTAFYTRLLGYLKTHFPEVTFDVEYIWPGFLGVSKDFLPIVARDPEHSNIHYIGAASGLPWAAALANYVADAIVSGRSELDSYFSPDRKQPIGPAVQTVIGTPATFALSHGIIKYLK